MIITCEQCETSFNLDEGLLKPAGSKVRCSKCKHIFVAYPPAQAEKVEETVAGLAVTDIAGEGVEETAETSLSAETRDEAEEEELDLSGLDEELKLTDEAEEAAAGEPAEEDFSLDFDLDVEEKEPAAAEAGEEELDLSDIESMLEEDAPAKTAKKTVEDEAGIEFEAEEIDLSELEKMLDAEEESEPAAEAAEETEDLELDLDIDIEPDPETAAETGGKETELETEDLDLTDLETELELDETPAAEVQADPSEDLELEFITEEPQEEELQLDEVTEEQISDGATEEILMTVEDEPTAVKEKADEAAESEQKAEEKMVEKRRKKAVAFKPKKRVSPLLVVLLVILLLIGGVVMLPTFGIQIPYVGDFVKNIPVGDYLRNIPYVGDLLGSKVDERGNLKMATFDIDSKFVENAKSGTLFVISGKIRNGYDHPRGFVKVTGRLYSKGKKLSTVQTVFCGNTLTDKDVSSLDMEAVRKKLLERTGQKQSNVRVPPGMHVPFMLVFSDLPPDLEEFDIQIEESLPAS